MAWIGIRYAHDAIFISFRLPEVRTAYSFRCFFSCWFCLWPNLSLQMPFSSCFIHKPGHQALHCKMQWYREAIFLSCQALPRLIRADTLCPLCIILPGISSPSRITSQFFSRPWNLQMIPAWKMVESGEITWVPMKRSLAYQESVMGEIKIYSSAHLHSQGHVQRYGPAKFLADIYFEWSPP